MAEELNRFSVTMPTDLCIKLDKLAARRGNRVNRSEVIRDLVRDAIQEDETEVPDVPVMATLTIMYDHHANNLTDELHEIQHDFCDYIVSTTHVHVNEHKCLEVIIMRGENEVVRLISDRILGTKGVEHGKLVLTVMEK